jgi:hypothetical protein
MTSPIALYNTNYYIVISKNDKLLIFCYKYIPLLICFVRIDFSEQPCHQKPESEIRWEVHFQQNILTIEISQSNLVIKGLRCEIRWEVHFQQNISTIEISQSNLVIKGLRCEIRWEVHFQQNISTIEISQSNLVISEVIIKSQ